MDSPRRRRNKITKTLAEVEEVAEEQTQIENVQRAPTSAPEGLFIEPFYGGSHKQLIDTLLTNVPNSHLVILTAKKWHWRARCGALILASLIPEVTTERFLFCSSVLSLAELLGIRADLNALKKIVYFHENQLVYPIREIKERDIQFAYNQIMTCLAADVVIFNSQYNKESFLENIKNIVRVFPDNKPKDLRSKIEPKALVLHFPLDLLKNSCSKCELPVLHIVWSHRWEFDKDPETFLNILLRLKSDNITFKVSILGETFADVPEIFTEAKEQLNDEIINFGYMSDKDEYYGVLKSSHVAVSTAKHEFYGVSMLEATYFGCFPLVPNRLVYPEIYPAQCLYSDETELYLRLKQYSLVPDLATEHRNQMKMDFGQFTSEQVLPKFLELFN